MYVGVMSGTSMDAVDLAVVDFASRGATLVATSSWQWSPDLQNRLRAFADGQPLNATALARLDVEIGWHIAEGVNMLLAENAITNDLIRAVGCHGQTVAHAPNAEPAATLQLGDANVIVERTGITTINDFRRRDVAAGGQGAPLAPAFHAAMLRSTTEDRVVLNLGGIANVTLLPADPALPVIGFDTGPANCLMDDWIWRHRQKRFDAHGEWAAIGDPDQALLMRFLEDPYFDQPPPKSTGTQYFSREWLDRCLGDSDLTAERVQATLLELTAASVSAALDRHAPRSARVYVCGGGVHNATLMRRLEQGLQRPVASTSVCGLDPDWMEAMAFAWLAMRTLEGNPGNLPSVTAAAGPRILGAIHPS
ncbi:MAG: anhydro-N-acetylmuramic acid kinase [Gammaproteobacteria bacterium]|nr:anhydro-N-acetylmuramic acid kinase [Gammaproteobacteria bacterium]